MFLGFHFGVLRSPVPFSISFSMEKKVVGDGNGEMTSHPEDNRAKNSVAVGIWGRGETTSSIAGEEV